MPELKLKSGDLSVYGLACGYIQTIEHNGYRLKLWHGGAVFHVQCSAETGPIVWETTNKIGEARRLYQRIRQQILRGETIIGDNYEIT